MAGASEGGVVAAFAAHVGVDGKVGGLVSVVGDLAATSGAVMIRLRLEPVAPGFLVVALLFDERFARSAGECDFRALRKFGGVGLTLHYRIVTLGKDDVRSSLSDRCESQEGNCDKDGFADGFHGLSL